MKNRQIFFFADNDDLINLLKEIEFHNKIKYWITGLFDVPVQKYFNSLLNFENLGYVSIGDSLLVDEFLIMPDEENLNIRAIPQKKGGIKYAIDQGKNQNSIYIRLGGIYNKEILIESGIGTTSNSKFSIDLYNYIFKLLKSKFKKVGYCFVGLNVLEMLEAG